MFGRRRRGPGGPGRNLVGSAAISNAPSAPSQVGIPAGQKVESLRDRARRLTPVAEHLLAEYADAIGLSGADVAWFREQMAAAEPDPDLGEALDSIEDLVARLTPPQIVMRRLDGTILKPGDRWDEDQPARRFFDGPFTAPPPTGPTTPPGTLTAGVPHLAATLAGPEPAIPARRDWSWRAGDPGPRGD